MHNTQQWKLLFRAHRDSLLSSVLCSMYRSFKCTFRTIGHVLRTFVRNLIRLLWGACPALWQSPWAVCRGSPSPFSHASVRKRANYCACVRNTS